MTSLRNFGPKFSNLENQVHFENEIVLVFGSIGSRD